jgi:uncharacterized membrane protein
MEVDNMTRDIEPILKKFEVKTLGNKKNLEKFLDLIKEDEELLFISPTNLTVKNVNTNKRELLPGICALTNKRFVFQNKVLFQTKIESINLENIDNISYETDGLYGHVIINSLSKSYSMLVSYKKNILQLIQETFESAIQEAIKGSNSSGNSSSVADEIKKYKELLDMGAITEEEFEKKKKELLK